MADILARAAHYIDNGVYEGAGLINRPTTELSEVGDGVALIEAFSHVVAFRSGDGLVLFDTSLEAFAGGVLTSLRRWTDEPVTHVCYTHGHADHVGGTGAILCEACERGHTRPKVVAHENVSPRFRRYELTNGYISPSMPGSSPQQPNSAWARERTTRTARRRRDGSGPTPGLIRTRPFARR
ncbi:MBL fold metallo-hydrolase [Pyruvatibacter mobilis]|uniref:MBL fold metallo-hydrolase n=1 Tax=Pyruvatibacter mobilis TaxID=1712261 RepID=UPI003BA9A800